MIARDPWPTLGRSAFGKSAQWSLVGGIAGPVLSGTLELRVIDLAMITETAADLVRSTRIDYLGFWEVFERAKRLADAGGFAFSSDQIRSLTLEIAETMLDDPSIGTGMFRPTGMGRWVFEKWGLPKNVAMARIKDEWVKLGKDPGLGDIVWFVSNG
jgi:hypothetical protein